MTRAVRSFVIKQEAEQAALIEALVASGDLVAADLAEKLGRCRTHREQLRAWGGKPDLRSVLGSGGRIRCGLHACWSCSRRLVRKISTKAAERFHDADVQWCSAVTVGIALTGDLAEVRDAVVAFRRGLRDRRDATARARSRWTTLEAVGHVELDAHWQSDIQHIAPERRAMVESLPVLAYPGAGEPFWVIHAHLACHHPDIDRAEVKDVFTRQWAGPNRVHVEAFHDHQLPAYAAGSVVSYSVKNAQCSAIGHLEEEWPVSWRSAWWTWLHGMRRGLQPLHVALGARRLRPSSSMMSILESARHHQPGDDEPMPMLFG